MRALQFAEETRFCIRYRFSDAASASTTIIPLAGCEKSRISYQGMPSGIPQVAQNQSRLQALAHGFILLPRPQPDGNTSGFFLVLGLISGF
jgi:hypothetical protein